MSSISENIYQTSWIQEPRDIFFLTDNEADDRKALEIVVANLKSGDRLSVGCSLFHTTLKKTVVKKFLEMMKFPSVPVYAGTGKEFYGDVPSLKGAQTFTQEGEGILSAEEIEEARKEPISSLELQMRLEEHLENAKPHSVEISLLVCPVDLAAVLAKRPDLKEKIKCIYMMSGWVEMKDSTTGEIVRKTTYNADIDIPSTQAILSSGVPILLLSSSLIKPTFGGGSINKGNYPAIFHKIDEHKEQVEFLRAQEKSSAIWSQHIINTIPPLKNIIGPFADHQYTPADPCAAIAMFNPKAIKELKQVKVTIDPTNAGKSACELKLEDDNTSSVYLVTAYDPAVFESETIKATDILVKRVLQ